MESLTSIATVRSLMEKYGLRFSKALGQNFLINPSVCPRMAELAGADRTVGALEIGPGVGVLTRELATTCKKVVAVELDEGLLPLLGETLAPHDNVSVVHGDIMKIDVGALLQEHFAGMDVIVCANLPYYITSPVIMKLLEERLPVRAITVMVQKEAAARLCAPIPSRQAGAVTLAVAWYARAEILFPVSRGSFLPQPEVDSSVIRLDVRGSPPFSVQDEALLFRVIRAAFGQRRKTLLNSVSAGLGMSRDVLGDCFAESDISPGMRAEQLSLEQFARLADTICRQRASQ